MHKSVLFLSIFFRFVIHRIVESSRALPQQLSVSAVAAIVLISGLGCAGKQNSRPGDVFDAGRIFAEKNPALEHTYVVRNITDRPVRVTNVRASCTCASTKLKKYELAPGESTELVIAGTVPNVYSKASLVCTLLTDSPAYPEWNYELRFVSLPRLILTPTAYSYGSFRATDLDSNGAFEERSGAGRFHVGRLLASA